VGSDASGGSTDSEEVVVGEGGQVGYWRRRGDSHRKGEEEALRRIFKTGGRGMMVSRRGVIR